MSGLDRNKLGAFLVQEIERRDVGAGDVEQTGRSHCLDGVHHDPHGERDPGTEIAAQGSLVGLRQIEHPASVAYR
jgi:hypothetical protein